MYEWWGPLQVPFWPIRDPINFCASRNPLYYGICSSTTIFPTRALCNRLTEQKSQYYFFILTDFIFFHRLWLSQTCNRPAEQSTGRTYDFFIKNDEYLSFFIGCSVSDPDPHGSAWKNASWIRIQIQEVKKPRKCKGSLGEYRTGRTVITKFIFCLLILNDFEWHFVRFSRKIVGVFFLLSLYPLTPWSAHIVGTLDPHKKLVRIRNTNTCNRPAWTE